MNLQNPACLRAVLEDAASLLKAYDWDGVNLGEFTFESPWGPERPDTLTPFNATARGQFLRRYGFDMMEIFKPASPYYWKRDPDSLQKFYAYRKDVNARLLEQVLKKFEDLKKTTRRPMETVVTLFDGLQHPELQDYLGFNFAHTLGLINQYGATMQVEDPASEWSKPPARYKALGARYSALALKKPYMIDVNVLPVHSSIQPGFATAKPTGAEMFQLLHDASLPTGRVCVYSESTVNEQDWEILPYGMASQASIRKHEDGWQVDTPFTVLVELGMDAHKVRLDGQPWFCAANGDVWVPPGEHIISFSRTAYRWLDTSKLDTHLLSLSGELLGSQKTPRGMEVEYRAPQRCAMIFDKRPLKIYVDEQPYKGADLKGDEGFTVMAPPGLHHMRVITESAFLYFVQFTSLVSASLIVLFGAASSGLLALLFMLTSLRRLWRRGVPWFLHKTRIHVRRGHS